MVRRYSWLCLLALAGCGHAQPRSKPDYDAVRRRAEQSVQSMEREGHSATVSQPAPEAAPVKAKVLAKDPKGCTWIESEGTVTVGEQESRHQARAAAIAEARKSAMQDFLGVEVKSRFLDYQQEGLRDQQSLTESILQTTRLGRILDEQSVAEGYQDLPGCSACRYHVKLKTCLIPIPEDSDKDFHVELGISRTRFVEGDEAKLTVTATRPCYVYLYDVGMDWETMLLVPNDYVPEVQLKAGQVWEYPNEEVQKRGVKLVAQLPEGKSISAETIRVVASKTPLPLKREDPAMGGYLGLLRRMNSSRMDWAEDAQAFTIYKH